MPANYKPKSETEKALMDSLKQLEMQCKERVDLLQALQESRKEAEEKAAEDSSDNPKGTGEETTPGGWLGDGTIPPIDYPDLARPPSLPTRPPPVSSSSASELPRIKSAPQYDMEQETGVALNPIATVPTRTSRTPSPEKKSGMLRTLRPQGRSRGGSSSSKVNVTARVRPPPASAKAASLAFTATPRQDSLEVPSTIADAAARNSTLLSPSMNTSRASFSETSSAGAASAASSAHRKDSAGRRRSDYRRSEEIDRRTVDHRGRQVNANAGKFSPPETRTHSSRSEENLVKKQKSSIPKTLTKTPPERKNYVPLPPPKLEHNTHGVLSYRKEYPDSPTHILNPIEAARRRHGRPISRQDSEDDVPALASSSAVRRKPVSNPSIASPSPTQLRTNTMEDSSSSLERSAAAILTSPGGSKARGKTRARASSDEVSPASPTSDVELDSEQDVNPPTLQPAHSSSDHEWEKRKAHLLKHLPPGVDESSARSILNEVVVHGDSVHWSDIAGLDAAKSTLKETVVYPFLRPDLFSGLREPARGLLLFGPPGTGKTMLARAVATESKSTFFSLGAGSLVSKFLGDSEKLVRALFGVARALAPSIIFVDEIDALLGARGRDGEHEASRRLKSDFLVRWSDLQRAAAGREDARDGDATRVLVLAATNLPWAIDEAARRRFVRRQYIPLPEDAVRKTQILNLLSHQKHELSERDIEKLVILTDGTSSPLLLLFLACRKVLSLTRHIGFSGSDITALAKDAAMGPLRSLGEKLLHMSMDEIRPIQFEDFQASLLTIRPSVNKAGLRQYEQWAREFGERGG